MRNPLKGMFRGRDAPGVKDAVSSAPDFQFGTAASGKSVTEQTAIQISAVYACVRVLAETIASLPLHVYESDGKGGSRIAREHPLDYLVHDAPNEEMTSYQWREQMMTQIMLHGNSLTSSLNSTCEKRSSFLEDSVRPFRRRATSTPRRTSSPPASLSSTGLPLLFVSVPAEKTSLMTTSFKCLSGRPTICCFLKERKAALPRRESGLVHVCSSG